MRFLTIFAKFCVLYHFLVAASNFIHAFEFRYLLESRSKDSESYN